MNSRRLDISRATEANRFSYSADSLEIEHGNNEQPKKAKATTWKNNDPHS